MNPFEYIVTLRITHPKRDLSDIFDKLKTIEGLKPGRIWKAGEPRKTPQGQRLEGYYDNSYCYFDLAEKWKKDNEEPMLELIEDFFKKLSTFEEMFKNFNKDGGDVNIIVAIHVAKNCGEMIPVDLIKKFAHFGIGLGLDLYPPDKSN